MPYGWQPIGERKLVPVSGSSYPSLQALGFQKPDGTIRCYFHRGTVNSETVIEVIDHFASYLRRPAILVIETRKRVRSLFGSLDKKALPTQPTWRAALLSAVAASALDRALCVQPDLPMSYERSVPIIP